MYGWAKSIGKSKYNIPCGRVFCHTPAMVRWTSPITGNVQISGGVWAVRNLEGRVQEWQLRKNGVPLTGARISWSKSCTSATPQPFRREAAARLRSKSPSGKETGSI